MKGRPRLDSNTAISNKVIDQYYEQDKQHPYSTKNIPGKAMFTAAKH